MENYSGTLIKASVIDIWPYQCDWSDNQLLALTESTAVLFHHFIFDLLHSLIAGRVRIKFWKLCFHRKFIFFGGGVILSWKTISGEHSLFRDGKSCKWLQEESLAPPSSAINLPRKILRILIPPSVQVAIQLLLLFRKNSEIVPFSYLF